MIDVDYSDPPDYPCGGEIAPNCSTAMKHGVCGFCYKSGVYTYIIVCLTSVIQIPLVWLSILRATPSIDSRCRKFLTLPLTLLVIIGSLATHYTWRQHCYVGLVGLLEEIRAYEAFYGDGEPYNYSLTAQPTKRTLQVPSNVIISLMLYLSASVSFTV